MALTEIMGCVLSLFIQSWACGDGSVIKRTHTAWITANTQGAGWCVANCSHSFTHTKIHCYLCCGCKDAIKLIFHCQQMNQRVTQWQLPRLPWRGSIASEAKGSVYKHSHSWFGKQRPSASTVHRSSTAALQGRAWIQPSMAHPTAECHIPSATSSRHTGNLGHFIIMWC